MDRFNTWTTGTRTDDQNILENLLRSYTTQTDYTEYCKNDIANTSAVANAKRREIMNGLTIGDVVYSSHKTIQGRPLTIFAFDYAHYVIGCTYQRRSDPNKLGKYWIDPFSIVEVNKMEKQTKERLNVQYGIGNVYPPKAKRVIYDEAAGVTVVLWKDGTKTIVRAAEGETHDAYLGYCIALTKKLHGTNSALKRDLENVLVVKAEKGEDDA